MLKRHRALCTREKTRKTRVVLDIPRKTSHVHARPVYTIARKRARQSNDPEIESGNGLCLARVIFPPARARARAATPTLQAHLHEQFFIMIIPTEFSRRATAGACCSPILIDLVNRTYAAINIESYVIIFDEGARLPSAPRFFFSPFPFLYLKKYFLLFYLFVESHERKIPFQIN